MDEHIHHGGNDLKCKRFTKPKISAHRWSQNFSNSMIEYIGEIETIFENTSAC